MHADLRFIKERVGELKVLHGEDAWRTAVNFADPYSTLPMQKRVPSRAYFKWVELSALIGDSCPGPILHLCEAPGGFVQAHWDMHRAEWHAHSMHGLDCIRFKRLPPTGRVLSNVPEGGDLLKDSAYEHMSSLPRKYSIVTADGSVDFEAQHARAEECNFLLALRQTLVARSVLAKGGSFVLKLFDMAVESTWGLVQLLTDWFGKVCIAKPASSRGSNGECYAVCTGLKEEEQDSESMRLLERVSSGSVARLYAALDPSVVRDLSRADLPSSQLSALRRAIGVCTGKSADSVDLTDQWWKGPGRAIVR